MPDTFVRHPKGGYRRVEFHPEKMVGPAEILTEHRFPAPSRGSKTVKENTLPLKMIYY